MASIETSTKPSDQSPSNHFDHPSSRLKKQSNNQHNHHHHHHHRNQNHTFSKENGWRPKPKRGISLDNETIIRSIEFQITPGAKISSIRDSSKMIDVESNYQDDSDGLKITELKNLTEDDRGGGDCGGVGDGNRSSDQNLFDQINAQFRRKNLFEERDQNDLKRSQKSSSTANHLIKMNSLGDSTNASSTISDQPSYCFTGDDLQFRQQDSLTMDSNNIFDRGTRATTPADEQIFSEPIESLQIRIGRLLSCEEMSDMHFLIDGQGFPSSSPSILSNLSINPQTSPPNRQVLMATSKNDNSNDVQSAPIQAISSAPSFALQSQRSVQSNMTTPTILSATQSPLSSTRKIRIPAHRLIMATASPVFKQLLQNPNTGQLIECTEDFLITEIDPGSFLEFLRFAYTDSAKLNKDNVVGVLVAARRYQTSSLQQQCIEFIRKCLTKRSSLAIWSAARIYGETALESVARKSIQHFAESILLSNDFLRLDQSSLCELLSDDLLRADEIVIFRALTRWAKQNCLRNQICPTRANVRQALGNTLNLIRFPLMSEEQLQKIVAAEGILDDELLRSLVHCSRNLPHSSSMMRTDTSLTFSNEPRAYQRLHGRLHNVHRFASFDNSLPNRYLNRSLNFLTNKRIWLAGIGLYAPRKACTFYLNVSVRVRRADHDSQIWNSPLDRIEQTIVFKYDGNGHIINVNFDEPMQIEANIQYEASATITPSSRTTSLVRARLHPHLYYTRPSEINFYYGTDGQYATKVRINNRAENVIFNFNWERDSIQDETVSETASQQNFDSNNLLQLTGSGTDVIHRTIGFSTPFHSKKFQRQSSHNESNRITSSIIGSSLISGATISSEPSTPNPPPRPPPPQEYRRPSRMQRLRRALSFIDNRNYEKEDHQSMMTIHESGLLEGQIPLLMFYA